MVVALVVWVMGVRTRMVAVMVVVDELVTVVVMAVIGLVLVRMRWWG